MKIIDDEEYEKNKTFTIVLEEPILLEVGQRHGELWKRLNATFIKSFSGRGATWIDHLPQGLNATAMENVPHYYMY